MGSLLPLMCFTSLKQTFHSTLHTHGLRSRDRNGDEDGMLMEAVPTTVTVNFLSSGRHEPGGNNTCFGNRWAFSCY